MPNLFRLFKKFDAEPLPKFPAIALEEIVAGDALLFYGKVKLTTLFGNRVYRHKYAPPAFHAALAVGDGKILNVGKFKTIEDIKPELRSTRRVDVIRYSLTDAERTKIKEAALQDVDKPKVGFQLPTYAFTDYLRFGVKWFPPSDKDFCSENEVEIVSQNSSVYPSFQEPYNTAPWHLLEWALAVTPSRAQVKTLWIGPEFMG